MFERMLYVKFVPFKNSFLYLPSNCKQENSETYCKAVCNNNKIIYFYSCSLSANLDENSVGINSLFAKSLGIKENELLSVSEISQLPAVKSIVLCPLTNEDYEVLELLAENVQETLLEQLRVVYSSQNVVIWIGKNITVNVIIEEVKPVSPGVIGFLTEVVIKTPSPIRKNNKLSKEYETKDSAVSELIKFMGQTLNQETDILKTVNMFKDVKQDCIFRVIPLQYFPFLKNTQKPTETFCIFAPKKGFPKAWHENSLETPVFSSIQLLSSSVFSSKKIYVKIYFIEDVFQDYQGQLSKNNIFVNEEIFNNLECDFGDRVILEALQKRTNVMEIEIHAKSFILNIGERVKKYLANNSKQSMILTADFVIEIEKDLNVSFEFLPERSSYCIIEGDFLREIKYSLVDVPLHKKEAQLKIPKINRLLDISNFQEIVENILLSCKINGNTENFDNFLCTGNPGTGKTTLLQIVLEKLQEYPNFVHTEIIQCKKIKGKTVDSLHKVFVVVFCKLVLSQPSVLFLDDLHVLCENVTKGEETPNSVYYNRVSEMINGFLSLFSKYSTIGIIASAESANKLNENIYKSRGSHLFKNMCCIDELTKTDRKKILEYLFVDTTLDFGELSLKTDGFVIQDIIDFYNKTLFEAYKDEVGKDVKITQEHCSIALQNMTALSLQNVKFHEGITKSFEDVGGLNDVKKILVESLLWPAQYPSIFGFAPLRPQSGLLLYGPPGTGKTLVAGAAARQCGLRLISVKGPELLSKYIGASEQAIRDVFDKAQSAKPCILFFDEFDSLAPRRGHDNTGVTDRVVNQLLTRLDGIEALIGVSVIAATSRPDLLDPALLRPGRLDRLLFCPLPDMDERWSILGVLSKNMDFSEDVDLKYIAKMTEGYSGADLQSILYTAQLSSVDYLWKSDEELHFPNSSPSKISQKHLEDALKYTKPSLTKSEREKYDRIYKKFQGGIIEDFKPGSKATLA